MIHEVGISPQSKELLLKDLKLERNVYEKSRSP